MCTKRYKKPACSKLDRSRGQVFGSKYFRYGCDGQDSIVSAACISEQTSISLYFPSLSSSVESCVLMNLVMGWAKLWPPA